MDWNFSKPKKIALGVATIYPFLYMILFVLSVFGLMIFQATSQPTPPGEKASGAPAFFLVLFGLHFLTMFWIFGLMAFYIVHLFKTERVSNDKKTLWAIVLFMGNMFAMPVYWYLYIWRDAPGASTATST